jgi:hypothetical protein
VIPVSAIRKARSAASRIAAWIAVWQRELSERVHRDGDALARSHGWGITETVGWFGFGGRIYRDPRFAERRSAAGTSTTRSLSSPGRAPWGDTVSREVSDA